MSTVTGNSCLMLTSGNRLGWTIPGLIKSSRLITSPKPGTTVLPLGIGASLGVVLLDALAVVGGVAGDCADALAFCSSLVSVFVVSVVVGTAPVIAVTGSAGVTGAGVILVTPALLTAGVVACVATGLTGLIGLVGFVTFVIDLTQLFNVVTQGCHTG